MIHNCRKKKQKHTRIRKMRACDATKQPAHDGGGATNVQTHNVRKHEMKTCIQKKKGIRTKMRRVCEKKNTYG